nr:hypothetical protein CFP56_28599 [Quercus suber]
MPKMDCTMLNRNACGDDEGRGYVSSPLELIRNKISMLTTDQRLQLVHSARSTTMGRRSCSICQGCGWSHLCILTDALVSTKSESPCSAFIFRLELLRPATSIENLFAYL